MKKREGFVSNSSSSNFVCNVCDNDYSGRDVGLNEAEMIKCSNGHIVCEYHLSKTVKDMLTKHSFEGLDFEIIKLVFMEDSYVLKELDTTKQEVKVMEETEFRLLFAKQLTDDGYSFEDFRYSLPSAWCPICQFEELQYDDIAIFLMYTRDLTMNSMRTIIKKEFDTYENFTEKLKEMKKKINR